MLLVHDARTCVDNRGRRKHHNESNRGVDSSKGLSKNVTGAFGDESGVRS